MHVFRWWWSKYDSWEKVLCYTVRLSCNDCSQCTGINSLLPVWYKSEMHTFLFCRLALGEDIIVIKFWPITICQGLARSMPTSGALDRVAEKLNVPFFEVSCECFYSCIYASLNQVCLNIWVLKQGGHICRFQLVGNFLET